jgi:hypothetical protein
MPSAPVPDEALTFERPWFPGLAERLVAPALAARGFSPDGYGTRRWIEAVSAASPADSQTAPPEHWFEPPPPSLAEPYAALGLRFAGLPDASGCALLRDAFSYLELVPDVADAVRSLVLAIHLLEAPGPGYDVSHSDPDLPCSIFLSLPFGEPHAALRAAESILHEAMHLQLTLLEAASPPTQPGQGTHYSPWQQRQRPILGVVHGLYVFSAIDAFLGRLLDCKVLADETADFAGKRRREIADEIAEVRAVARHRELTPFGRRFVRGLLSAPWRAPGP